MSIYQPYFYVIQDVRNGMYYAGAKWAKWAKDADQKELLKEGGYKTSSKIINSSIEEFGLETFIIRKIKVFETSSEAHNYETKFLKKVNAKNNSKFYNKHNNDGYTNPEHMKKYMMETYGVEHNTKLKSTIEKRIKTINEKFGNFSNMMKETRGNQKSFDSCMKNNGVSNPFQLQYAREKAKKTCLEKYGYKTPFENKEIQHKASITGALILKQRNDKKYEFIKIELEKSNIDFSKRGWCKYAAAIIGINSIKTSKWMIRNMPEFYYEKCLIRKTPVRN